MAQALLCNKGNASKCDYWMTVSNNMWWFVILNHQLMYVSFNLVGEKQYEDFLRNNVFICRMYRTQWQRSAQSKCKRLLNLPGVMGASSWHMGLGFHYPSVTSIDAKKISFHSSTRSCAKQSMTCHPLKEILVAVGEMRLTEKISTS